MPPDTPATFRALIVAFTDFLTVALHTILWARNVYPKESFVKTRKYNLAVRQNRHPDVCEWINDALRSVEEQLLKCAADRVAVVLYDEKNVPLERFVFDVSPFPIVAYKEIDTPMVRGSEDADALLPIVDMEEQFRALLMRLMSSALSLKAIPEGCTFTIAIELKLEGHHAPIQHPQAWIPVAPLFEETATGSLESTDSSPRVLPVRAMAAGELAFDAWIEESAVKITPPVVSGDTTDVNTDITTSFSDSDLHGS